MDWTSAARTAIKLLGLAFAGPAIAAAPLEIRSASVQCAANRVELQAACFPYTSHTLACTRQSLQFVDADGKVLAKRVFQPQPLEQGDDYPVVEEKVGTISCVQTDDKRALVVASMFNGGNCPQCEWTDVYGEDGKLVGSTRERNGDRAALSAALQAVRDKQAGHVRALQTLRGFYQIQSGK